MTSSTGVSQIIAGANVTISPPSGKGIVTISANGSTTGAGFVSTTGYYLNAYDITTQSAANATTAYVVNIGNVASANGMTITNGNQVYFTFSGVYEVANAAYTYANSLASLSVSDLSNTVNSSYATGNAASNTAVDVADSTNTTAYNQQFVEGTSGYTEANAPVSILATAYDLYAQKEDVDISLLIQGKPTGGTTTVGGMTVENFQLANYLIQSIAEARKDCVVFITPDRDIVTSNAGNEAQALVNWRNAVVSSSYAVLDSGYKYQYDRYNDVYRYVPTNGDIAGLCATTDSTRDPWYSPAGFARGQIKNVVKLAYNPSTQAARDLLYKNGINPIVTFPGQGTILYGDKTLLAKPSAFDRINVRRLFIVLEKAIQEVAKTFLFEFNDEFTQAQFRNVINPYLRDIQGRRGITDYLVVCDATNNTPQVVDSNQFVGDIYIKPERSINFIQLNFVAVNTGVEFQEIVGQF